jgi:hypothetical protein
MGLVIYEWVSYATFALALWWALRSRDPLCLGALLGGALLFAFDWMWCSRAFFNATFAPQLTPIPGLHIRGQSYPIAVMANWAVGFGFLPYLLSLAHGSLSRRLGVLHYPAVFIVAALYEAAAEMSLVTGLGVYTYHQAPDYLVIGVPWSNFWFLSNTVAFGYFALAYARRWAVVPERSGFDPRRETTWKGLLMPAGALFAVFFLLTVVQLFWYSAVTPWVDAGRAF